MDERRAAAVAACEVVLFLGGSPLDMKWKQLTGFDDEALAPIRSKACHDAARWISELRNHREEETAKEYLELATKAFADVTDDLGASSCFVRLAEFADRKHASLRERMRTTEFRQSDTLLRKKREELEACEGIFQDGKKEKGRDDLRRHIAALRKQILVEQQELENFREQLEKWLIISVVQYSKALKAGSANIKVAFRLIALWLAHWAEPSVSEVCT